MKRDEEKGVVSMPTGGPHIDPVVAARNPAAAKYAQSVVDRMKGAEPRGGPASPPIPRLDAPYKEGMTMADHANVQRQPPPQQASPSMGVFSPDQASRLADNMHQGILPMDTLPEAARQDPDFREGHGSLYATNQPHLAKKYGVIRGGQHIAPQELQSGRPGLSSKTVEGMKAIQEFNQQRKHVESGDDGIEKQSQSAAGQAARLANTAGSDDVSPSSKEEVEQAIQNMDEFDFNSFREAVMKDLLNNDEQRKIIEDRVQPLDLSDLIINGYVTQTIPIIPGKYEPEFQSFTGEEELALKRLLMEERKGLEVADRYLLDKYSLMTVALGLRSVNKQLMPSHTDQAGNFNDELFWKKFNRVLKLPFHMLASLGVHYYWFDVRVRKLFVAENIKNG